jgi:hypothetical protein
MGTYCYRGINTPGTPFGRRAGRGIKTCKNTGKFTLRYMAPWWHLLGPIPPEKKPLLASGRCQSAGAARGRSRCEAGRMGTYCYQGIYTHGTPFGRRAERGIKTCKNTGNSHQGTWHLGGTIHIKIHIEVHGTLVAFWQLGGNPAGKKAPCWRAADVNRPVRPGGVPAARLAAWGRTVTMELTPPAPLFGRRAERGIKTCKNTGNSH